MRATTDTNNVIEDEWGYQGDRCDGFYPHAESKYFSLDRHGVADRYRKKIFLYVGGNSVTPSRVDASVENIHNDVGQGLDFILSHLEGQTFFPRNIMTKRVGYQIEVFDKESIIREFLLSDYQDCRISAYPSLTKYNDLNLVAPSLVMIDLDLNNFKSEIALNKALKSTLDNIYGLLKVRPTVLVTGNGYHIYLPIKAFVLEEESVFASFVEQNEPDLSTKFMRYAEQFFTKGRHDQQHKPSVNNCLLRVPGTYNSKNGELVKVIQKWDGHRPAIQYMLRDFRVYLIQERLDQINAAAKKIKPSDRFAGHSSNSSIDWIEGLLQTPVADYRKYCIWRILAPYLVNIRGLSDESALSTIMMWLDKCNTVKRLSFYAKPKAREQILRSRRIGYYPISLNDLQRDNTELYDLTRSIWGEK